MNLSNSLKFTIPGRLPTLNEMINTAKRNKYAYAKMKEDNDDLVVWSSLKIPKLNPADFIITWVCEHKRFNKDNIMAGQKFIFDGLQKNGKIPNDGWDEVNDVTHRFEVDKHNPRIEVEIIERVTA